MLSQRSRSHCRPALDTVQPLLKGGDRAGAPGTAAVRSRARPTLLLPRGLWPGLQWACVNLDRTPLETSPSPAGARATLPAHTCPWFLRQSR